jgi:hypothetical protein
MKNILLLSLACAVFAAAQVKPKAIESIERALGLEKPSGIVDRAGGTHNASNIGLFFENRGKLYPRRLAQGPSGEFPINSQQHYIYRINPMVGFPANVIQGRFTTNEEWEAVGGYQAAGSAKIAFSDNVATWPVSKVAVKNSKGEDEFPPLWPVRDANGNAIIKSDQDSYCVYDDANNQLGALGVRVIQTGYTYGLQAAQNIIFFKFQIVTTGSVPLPKMYFNLYTDIDVGDVSGGDPEWGDDKIKIDLARSLVTFYDDGISTEWPSGKTGQIGVTMLQTPKVNGVELGTTDIHYNLYDDDRDQDTVLYGIMSSAPSLYNSADRNRYFHIGSSSNLHFDDPATIPVGGMDILANVASGPYTLTPGDTLTFVTAILAGTDSADLYRTYGEARKIFLAGFEAAKAPAAPKLTAVPGNKRVTLYWDDKAEASKDNYSGQYDFEGYRLYRSVNKGLTWTQLADYDIINEIGLDKGLKYSYTDSTVTNGIEYWYSITSFDRGGPGLASLESALGKVAGVTNLAVVKPRPDPLGQVPVTANAAQHIGNGKSNYSLIVNPVNLSTLGGGTYDVKFGYTYRYDNGAPKVKAVFTVGDSTKVTPKNYGFQFLAHNLVNLYDLSTGLELGGNPKSYNPISGSVYTIQGGVPIVLRIRLQPTDTGSVNYPKAGDYITTNFSVYVTKNDSDTVVAPRQFLSQPDKVQATYDGVIFSVRAPEYLQNMVRTGRQDEASFRFTVGRADSIKNNTYRISTTGKDTTAAGEAFVRLSVFRMSDTIRIAKFDTVFNFGYIDFAGIRGQIEFPHKNPPLSGNNFMVTSVIPVEPTLADRYRFTLQGQSTDPIVAAGQLSKIKVVPNPYIVSSLYEPEFGEVRREPVRQIQFTNLPAQCVIHIFTVDAILVKTIVHNENSGIATWDLKAEGGREVASGTYMYLVKSSGKEFLNRFAIIK